MIVTALLTTLRTSFLHIMTLLSILMFVFGIMGYYMFGYTDPTSAQSEWGSFSRAFLRWILRILTNHKLAFIVTWHLATNQKRAIVSLDSLSSYCAKISMLRGLVVYCFTHIVCTTEECFTFNHIINCCLCNTTKHILTRNYQVTNMHLFQPVRVSHRWGMAEYRAKSEPHQTSPSYVLEQSVHHSIPFYRTLRLL